jgi:hypothetical protein
VFFVDRSLGRNTVPEALREAGEEVMVHDEQFAQDAKDEEWLSRAGKEGWLVLSADKRIRYRQNELDALKEAGVKAFILTAKKQMKGAVMGGVFLTALPSIKNCALQHKGALIAHVWRDGRVQVFFPAP